MSTDLPLGAAQSGTMANMADNEEERRRLSAALRDLAVFTASTERQPWTVSWREVADKFIVDITNLDGAAGPLMECSWELLGEGASGAFELRSTRRAS